MLVGSGAIAILDSDVVVVVVGEVGFLTVLVDKVV